MNPVASPYFNFSAPEPTGVVGIVVPETPELLGLVSHVAPAIVAGNAVVAVLSEAYPLPGLELAEVFAPVVKRPERPVWLSRAHRVVSDIPPGLTPAERARANGQGNSQGQDSPNPAPSTAVA